MVDRDGVTNVEETFLLELERKADNLRRRQGSGDDLLSQVAADTAHVVAAMARTGVVTHQRCDEMRAQYMTGRMNWKTALAISLPLCATAFGILSQIVSHIVKAGGS